MSRKCFAVNGKWKNQLPKLKDMTSFQDLNLNKKYTYADYLTWTFEERVELLRGCIAKMSPAPNTKHQRITTDIVLEIGSFLKNKKCQVFSAPFDVRLPVALHEGKTTTVVQPDVVVICDETKLDQQGCNGAPDLVVEVLSPGNAKKEMKDKLEIYQEAGILEYWLVDPEHEFALAYTLGQENKYQSSLPYVNGDFIESKAIKGFQLEIDLLF